MPKLFVANCTKQRHEFIYRAPESTQTVKREIEPGAQIAIEGTTTLFDYVIAHHGIYGLVDFKDVEKGKGYNGLVYRLDKPVDVDAIEAGLGHNDQALTDMSTETRQAAAAASGKTLDESARYDGAKLTGLQVEVVEQTKGPDDNDTKMRQTIDVTDDPKGSDKGRQNSNKRR